jgi:quercetin dioxygenase-like cupin family protein
MPFLNFNTKNKVQIWDGVKAAFFHSEKLTFGHIILDEGAVVAEHSHIHEQWTHVIEGEMQFTINGETQVLSHGMTAYMPPNVVHSAKAISECRVIDCFMPVREDFVALERK